MNTEAFGNYEVSAPPTTLNTDGETWYDAQIISAVVARTASGDFVVGKDDDNKRRVDARFVIPSIINETTHKPEELSRRFPISYGQSNAGVKPWAVWAQFIEAATGIRCGDLGQRQVGPKDLEGKWVRLCPVLSSTGYVNIKEIKAPKSGATASTPAPAANGNGSSSQAQATHAKRLPDNAIAHVERTIAPYGLNADDLAELAERISLVHGFSTYDWKMLATREATTDFLKAAEKLHTERNTAWVDAEVPF